MTSFLKQSLSNTHGCLSAKNSWKLKRASSIESKQSCQNRSSFHAWRSPRCRMTRVHVGPIIFGYQTGLITQSISHFPGLLLLIQNHDALSILKKWVYFWTAECSLLHYVRKQPKDVFYTSLPCLQCWDSTVKSKGQSLSCIWIWSHIQQWK